MNEKVFTIDFDSSADCKKLLNQIKSRLGELLIKDNPDYNTKAEMNRRKFNACLEIIDTDITDLYADLTLSSDLNYYVYVHCDPNAKIALKKDGISTFGATLGMTHLPFYIGKGIGNRAFELDRNESHRKIRQKIKTFNKDILVTVLKDGLSERDALVLESKLIDIFGLTSVGGRLVNLDEGVKSKERKHKYSEQLKELNLFYKNSVKI